MVPAISLLPVSPSSAAPEGLTPHAPIYINGNAGFTPANGVTLGSGTENDSYIIENWDLSRIHIANTTAHFVIRNCYVHGTYGIDLWDVKNGMIENNTCQNNQEYGIYLWHSTNITLKNNKLVNNKYNFDVSGSDLSHFIHDIDKTNLVNGKPIYYLIDNSNLVINQDNTVGYLGLISCDNIRVENLVFGSDAHGIFLAYTENSQIKNCVFSNNENSIYLWESNNNTLIGNTIDNSNGIRLDHSNNNTLIGNTSDNHSGYWRPGINLQLSDNNTLIGNTCDNNYTGIFLYGFSDNNTLSGNTCKNNAYGIYLGGHTHNNNNYIYHNNFMNNTTQASGDGSNYWDNGYPSGGNYWSDYTGLDENRGENQDIPGSDGIGDTPYDISGGSNRDRYPLMNPWSPPAWRLIETWTGTVEAPALWQHIETWTETIRTIEWELIESWTGTVKALVPVLPAPSLISPADGTITDDSTPTFDWSDVAGAENYDLLVYDDADFSSPEIQVNVSASTYTPTAELPNDNYSWKVRARDAANNAGDWSSIWTRIINVEQGVDVFISPSYQIGLPGATLSYTVMVKNEGNISDTYALTATDTAGWGPTLSKDSLELAPKAYDTVTLTVTIPTDASVGDQDNITITAKSTVDPTVSDGAKCTAQATAIRRRVEVSISPGSKSGPPGETLTYTVTIANEGEAEDTYDLTVTDALAWGATVSPTSLTIAVGSSGTATVVVNIPDGTAGGTEDEITVKGTSRADLTVSDSATCIASAAAVRGVKVTISPENQSGKPEEILTYTVKNEGNVGDTYILSVAGVPDWSPRVENTSLTLNAGRAGETTLTVTIPPSASEGASMTVNVSAISVGDPTVTGSDTCRMTVTSAPEVAEEDFTIQLAISAFLIGAAILTMAYLLRVRSKRTARRRVLRCVSFGPR